jgi:hypothetical protein
MQGFSHEDAESFLGIVTEPAAFETVFKAEIQTILGTFRDYGDIRAQVVEMLALAPQGHFAIPGYDFHGLLLAKVTQR